MPALAKHAVLTPIPVQLAETEFNEFILLHLGLDHGIGHFMLFEVDSEARVTAPPIPKSPRTSSAASDRKSAPLPLSRQVA
jgi:hypothetical protein